MVYSSVQWYKIFFSFQVNHAAVAVNNKIFSFGGYCTGDDYKVVRPMDIHVLNAGNSEM